MGSIDLFSWHFLFFADAMEVPATFFHIPGRCSRMSGCHGTTPSACKVLLMVPLLGGSL